jgi:hypothetical protein
MWGGAGPGRGVQQIFVETEPSDLHKVQNICIFGTKLTSNSALFRINEKCINTTPKSLLMKSLCCPTGTSDSPIS